MSVHTKMPPINQKPACRVVVERPGQKKMLAFVSEKNFHKLEAFLEKYGESDSIAWKELAKARIAKYTQSGLVLRGARYREGLSQKELAKRSGISQENISKMENGQRSVGEKVAKRLAKILHIDPALFKAA